MLLRIETLRNALRQWSQDPALMQTLRAGWAIDLPGEVLVEAFATGRGLAINVTTHKVLLQLRHGTQRSEFAIPIAALSNHLAFEKWLRAIRLRAEQHLDYSGTEATLRDLHPEHWEPISDGCSRETSIGLNT